MTTLVGIVCSSLAVAVVAHDVHTLGHLSRTDIVDATSLGAFAVLWAVRFFVFDRWVFGRRHAAMAQ